MSVDLKNDLIFLVFLAILIGDPLSVIYSLPLFETSTVHVVILKYPYDVTEGAPAGVCSNVTTAR